MKTKKAGRIIGAGLTTVAMAMLIAGCNAARVPERPVKAFTIARNGISAHVIYYDKNAPSSVREAAEEVRRVINISCGADLPLAQSPHEPMLVLGDTPETRQAGINPAKLPEEGFRIKTKGNNVFIAGNDTPDGERTAGGGFSDGTYYGTMEFLERVTGVRRLMPCEWGEDIPHHDNLDVPEIDFSDAPDFRSRVMSRGWGRGESMKWMRFMRVPYDRQAVALDYGHAWHSYNMEERLKDHPEYMAMRNGRRLTVADNKAASAEPWKFCTTSEGLIDLFTNALLEEMDKKPGQRMWSIGPSDGGGWCECEKCKALDEPCDPGKWPGNTGAKSLTPRMFTFFNEVARRVAAKKPEKQLGCFAYAAYTYPPAKPMNIESNLFVMLAARPYYGFSLYHEDLAAEFIRLSGEWDARLHGRIGWFDYSTWAGQKCSVGAPYPPALRILKLIIPQIKKLGWDAIYWDAAMARGYGSMNTYLVARLMWDAEVDVDALAKEWLERAYGPGGEPMGRFYDLLDKKLAEYKQSKKYDFQYRCVPEQVKAIHAPIFPQMETLYREAMSKAQAEPQKKRLEMFGDNMVLLHWNLHKAGWLEKPEESIFYRTDEEFKAFLEKTCSKPSLSLIPNNKPELWLKPQLGVMESKPVSKDD